MEIRNNGCFSKVGRFFQFQVSDFFFKIFELYKKGYSFANPLNAEGQNLHFGEIPKRPTGTDCKSVDLCLRRFESCSPHQFDFSFFAAGVAQLVERQPSKLQVAGSSLVSRSSANVAQW
jgi:hypothetical protein